MILNKRASTKEKLLYILKRTKTSTIKDLMEHFAISEIAVRRHLHELVRQGFIEKRSHKQDVGRPYYTYKLTAKGHQTFPNQYETLPMDLLNDLEEIQGKEVVQELLKKRIEREESFFKEKITADDFDQRIHQYIDIQNEQGYMLEYERNEHGDYEITNYNCPIFNMASSYRQVCQNEKVVLGKVFPTSCVTPQAYITKGSHYCKWKITRPKQPEKIAHQS